jgi:hypothetical protein
MKVKKVAVKDLKTALEVSEQMWKEGIESHAYIIGYLQGNIKNIISLLEK